MALTVETLEELRGLLEQPTPVAERIASVRKNFPRLSLTRCEASDISGDEPVLETPEFSVYLVDTSEHCVRLTTALERATGLVVADK